MRPAGCRSPPASDAGVSAQPILDTHARHRSKSTTTSEADGPATPRRQRPSRTYAERLTPALTVGIPSRPLRMQSLCQTCIPARGSKGDVASWPSFAPDNPTPLAVLNRAADDHLF